MWLGIIQSSMSLSRLFGLQAWKKSKHVESAKVPSLALIGSSVFFALFAVGVFGKLSIVFWMLRIAILSAYFSAQRTLVQRLYAESRWRATVASAASSITQIGVIVFSGTVGLFGGTSALLICLLGAVITCVAGGCYVRVAVVGRE